MPSLQPIRLTVQAEQWDELLSQTNYLFKDVYSILDELKGVDDKSATIYTSPTYEGTPPPTYEALTASRLMATDASKVASSTDVFGWIAPTANQIDTADDADGTMTLSLSATLVLPGTLALGGKLTGGAHEIEGSNFDIDGGDLSAITISGDLTWSAAQNFDGQDFSNIGTVGCGAITSSGTLTLTAGRTTTWVAPGTDTLSTAAAAVLSGDCLMLMAGTYTQTVPIAATSRSFSIIGMGPDVSVIHCDACHGIVIDNSAAAGYQVTLKDFSLVCDDDSGTYNAINVTGKSTGGNTIKQLYIDNVDCIPYQTTPNDYWLTGIILTDVWNAKISNCNFVGAVNDTYAMNASIKMTDAVDPRVLQCSFFYASDGLQIIKSTQGITVTCCTAICCHYGAYLDADLDTGNYSSSHAIFTGNHFNTDEGAIYGNGWNQMYISSNLFYRQGSGTYIGIDIDGNDTTITGNYIQGDSDDAGVGTGILLNDKAADAPIPARNANACTIIGNVFAYFAKDIDIEANCDNNTVIGNYGDGTAHITNAGANNLIIEKSGASVDFGAGTVTATNFASLNAITGVALAISDYAYIDALTVGSDVDPGANNLVVDGSVGIGTAPAVSFHLEKTVAAYVAYIVNNHATAGDGLLVQAGDAATPETILLLRDVDTNVRFEFFADGTTTGFSPDIIKDLNIEDPTPDDYLNWALEDAEKPKKSYNGPWDGEEAQQYGIMSKKDERNRFGKDWIKMSMGTTIWAKAARQQIQSLEIEIERLKQILKDNNLITEN